MSRAFKPMPVVLDLVYENFSKYKNLIFLWVKWKKKFLKMKKKNGNGIYRKKKFNK